MACVGVETGQPTRLGAPISTAVEVSVPRCGRRVADATESQALKREIAKQARFQSRAFGKLFCFSKLWPRPIFVQDLAAASHEKKIKLKKDLVRIRGVRSTIAALLNH